MLLVLVVVCCDDRELARLQIGVKKRVDNCEMRSRKGDTLNVHYVVSLLPCCWVSQVCFA